MKDLKVFDCKFGFYVSKSSQRTFSEAVWLDLSWSTLQCSSLFLNIENKPDVELALDQEPVKDGPPKPLSLSDQDTFESLLDEYKSRKNS